MQVIIDTDIGDDVDDIMALAFALRRPEFRVLGVTTVGAVDGRCRMVSRLLKGMGLSGITIAAGREDPLAGGSYRRTPLQGAFAADEPSRAWPDAVAFILDTVQQCQGNVGIITLGPMTNVAAALQKQPDLGRQVQFIASMGGSALPGKRECNIVSDPEAAHLVLTCGARQFLGTWEVTRQFTLYPADEQIIASTRTPLAQMLWENIELWRPAQGSKPGPVLYDVSPIIWAMRPELYPTEQYRVNVVLEGDRRGCTDFVPCTDAGIAVSLETRVEEVKQLYLDTVLAPN